ncbi:Pimeloyl-ACP methyl ester carboxylesterase [Klenkia marina]|uniref:Pimeloyl-ACP methyl ester carboxylesterase n=1 Tax=Klenkia marina TaxID=1960309 RepID=A0A1G4XAB0_9ACTN|nr:alpha/beta hydrolase [Klenkia marina]SCX38092.1 Pimeloyl-ACP methyl ester carboxylesterase [Klenkia marina]
MPDDVWTPVRLRPGRVVRVHHREAGTAGRPLVLVHGLGMSGRSMLPALRVLARERRTLAPDLPGYGRTRGRGRTLGIAGLADALNRWMDAVGLDEVDLVGHSLGAQVVAAAVRQRPGRVQHLVLVGPTRDPSAPTWVGQAWRLLLDAPRERPALLPVAVRDYLRAGPLTMVAVLRHALRRPEEHAMGEVDVPTLVLRGSRDPVAGQQWCEDLAAVLPRGQLQVVPGGPHGLVFSAPEAFAAAVLEFCR